MKIIVKHNFEDKYTGEFRKVGDVLDIPKERLKEIQEAGDFVDVLEQEADPEKELEEEPEKKTEEEPAEPEEEPEKETEKKKETTRKKTSRGRKKGE